MADSEILDMLFDSSSGILGSQPKETVVCLDDTVFAGEKQGGQMDLGMPLDLEWSHQLETMNEDDLFNSLLETNLPDDLKQKAKYTDHDYSVASPASDSGISATSFSPSSSEKTFDGLIPMDLENDLFAPLQLKNYAADDLDDELLGIDPYMADNLSECSGSPGLTGNESPVTFDFDEAKSPSEESLTISTDGKTKVIQVVSMNSAFSSGQSLLTSFKPRTVNSKDLEDCTSSLPRLTLSDEEKELMRREGITLPTHLPLTREEEKVLRSVRRRIRNKASARNSRKKKQDYMEALEKRVKICTEEKRQLEKKVNNLEKQNTSLLGQLRKLQKIVSEGTRHTARTGTCAMILALSFALVLLPSYQSFTNGSADKDSSSLVKPAQVVGRSSRNLLTTDENNQFISDSKSNNYFPFINFPKFSPEEPVEAKEDSERKGQPYVHDPVDTQLKSNSDKVVHMEITRVPDDKLHNQSVPAVSVGRSTNMDLDDEL